MAELVRVAALTGYFPVMRSLGVDPAPLLRENGLSPEMLTDPEQFIAARAAIRLLERSADAAGCITLGLRMADERALANLGATSLVLAHQPTLRHVLQALGEFRNRINSTLVLQMETFGDEVVLREDFSLAMPESTRQSSDLALGVLARLCASVLGDGWAPLSVCFSHDAPPNSERTIFARLFRCRPEFNCAVNGIVLRAADLDRPNLRADADLAHHARGLIETVMSPLMRTTAQDVEQIIIQLLPAGRATVQHCAASMGLTVRTLQRMLDADGTSFSALLNRTRMQLSAQYLANPLMRVTDAAELLGYASTGAFTRWHAQMFGLSPRQWKASHRVARSEAERGRVDAPN